MIAARFADLWNNTYTARIQDALGNGSASLTLDDSNLASVRITGTPTGNGLKIRARALAQAIVWQRASDRVAISAEGQARLAALQIAAELLTKDRVASAVPSKLPTVLPAAQPPQSGAIDAADFTALAKEDPAKVIHDVLDAAQSALTDSAGFYQTAASDPGIVDFLTYGMAAEQKTSFVHALSEHTLTLQSAAAGPRWQSPNQATFMGLSAHFGGALDPGTADTRPIAARPANATSVEFGIARLNITWPSA